MTQQGSFAAFQRSIGNALIAWGALCTVAGAAMLALLRGEAPRHFALQTIAWGVIDALIGLVGRRGAAADGPVAPRARRLRWLLGINALADIGYILGGLWLIRRSRSDARKAGAGVGMVIQGAFLFCFDTILAFISRRWTRAG